MSNLLHNISHRHKKCIQPRSAKRMKSPTFSSQNMLFLLYKIYTLNQNQSFILSVTLNYILVLKNALMLNYLAKTFLPSKQSLGLDKYCQLKLQDIICIANGASYLFSESPVRVGVEVALLGLPRGFRCVESSRPSALCRLGVVWKMLRVYI